MSNKILFLLIYLLSYYIVGQQTGIDFTQSAAEVNISFEDKMIEGVVNLTFRSTQKVDTITIDARNMVLEKLSLDNKESEYRYDQSKIYIAANTITQGEHSLTIHYNVKPQKAVYFVKDAKGYPQIWTQGQGKYTSNWLPGFDDVAEKMVHRLTINYKQGYEVIANGKLLSKTENGDQTRWEYAMQKPMSSYLLAFAIGKYTSQNEETASKVPLQLYYQPWDSAKVEPTYRYTKQIFDFLEQKIGISYPWQNYKQIPVTDFLYAGMENTGTTIFSEAFVVDSTAYIDRNYLTVNAHELSHQWFGNLVTAQSGTHHWLQEGFATYYALLAEKELLGEDYFYFKLYESAEQLDAQSVAGRGTAVVDPKSNSLTFYQHGAWALFALEQKLGSTVFDTTIKTYLDKYQFATATTEDFLQVASEVSQQDLSEFQKLWLRTADFPTAEALKLLQKSPFMNQFLALAKERTQPLIGKIDLLTQALQFPVNTYLGQEAINQLLDEEPDLAIPLYQLGLDTGDLYVRQSIATTLSTIPEDFRVSYEGLLTDPSYATIEAGLYHLWNNFPQRRFQYLEQTKSIEGFGDYNVRVLWLALALNTSGYESNRNVYLSELNGYTMTRYSTATRRNAFTFLDSLQLFDDTSLQNLISGTAHFDWRYRDFCRKLFDKLLTNTVYQEKIVSLLHEPQNQKFGYAVQKIKLIPK